MPDSEDLDRLDPGEFDTQSPGVPDSFALGFFKLNDLNCFPGIFTYDVGDSASLFFSLDEDTLIAASHFSLHMYRLDRDRSDVDEDLEHFCSSENHLGVPTPHGDQSALALAVPGGWQHQAFHSRNGPRRAIVHTYIGPDRAAIIRYVLNRPDIAQFPRFIEINDSLQWVLGDWVVQKDYIQLGPATDISDSPLPDELRQKITAAIVRARQFLELPKLCTAAQIHQAIFDAVDRMIATNQPPRSNGNGASSKMAMRTSPPSSLPIDRITSLPWSS